MEGNQCVKSLKENKETDWRCHVGIYLGLYTALICSKVEADQEAGRFASKASNSYKTDFSQSPYIYERFYR